MSREDGRWHRSRTRSEAVVGHWRLVVRRHERGAWTVHIEPTNTEVFKLNDHWNRPFPARWMAEKAGALSAEVFGEQLAEDAKKLRGRP